MLNAPDVLNQVILRKVGEFHCKMISKSIVHTSVHLFAYTKILLISVAIDRNNGNTVEDIHTADTKYLPRLLINFFMRRGQCIDTSTADEGRQNLIRDFLFLLKVFEIDSRETISFYMWVMFRYIYI